MGLKKTLKKVAKVAKKAAPLIGLYAASKMGRLGKKKPLKPNYFGNSSAPGDANVAANIAGWNRGTDEVAARGSVDDKNDYYKKGGLVKKGKPKLAKKGWK